MTEKNNHEATIDIMLNQNKLSENSELSGLNENNEFPIFGSNWYVNNKCKKIIFNTFGLPIIKMKRNVSDYKITFNNSTGYSFDIHWHGIYVPLSFIRTS